MQKRLGIKATGVEPGFIVFTMELPPGIRYLAQYSHRILAPPASVFILNSVCQTNLHAEAPKWVLLLIYLLSFPVALTVTVLYDDYKIHRMAAACGAVVPVDQGDGSPGRIKTVLNASHIFEDKYLGKHIQRPPYSQTNSQNLHQGEEMATNGVYTWNFKMLFQNRVCISKSSMHY